MLFCIFGVSISVWGPALLNMYETVKYNAAVHWLNNLALLKIRRSSYLQHDLFGRTEVEVSMFGNLFFRN